jgi:hypothetical protein
MARSGRKSGTKKSAKRPAKAAPKRPAKAAPKRPTKARATGAPKRPAPSPSARAREVYKVSPLRGMSVADYIAEKLSGWQAEATRILVALVARAAPSSSVSIKWSQPVFEENGPFAFIKPAKAHLSFGFWRGGQLVDQTGGRLQRGDRMGHIKYTALDQIDVAALEPMVREAVRLNHEKGNPTLKAN